jgi:hypothetical protein
MKLTSTLGAALLLVVACKTPNQNVDSSVKTTQAIGPGGSVMLWWSDDGGKSIIYKHCSQIITQLPADVKEYEKACVAPPDMPQQGVRIDIEAARQTVYTLTSAENFADALNSAESKAEVVNFVQAQKLEAQVPGLQADYDKAKQDADEFAGKLEAAGAKLTQMKATADAASETGTAKEDEVLAIFGQQYQDAVKIAEELGVSADDATGRRDELQKKLDDAKQQAATMRGQFQARVKKILDEIIAQPLSTASVIKKDNLTYVVLDRVAKLNSGRKGVGIMMHSDLVKADRTVTDGKAEGVNVEQIVTQAHPKQAVSMSDIPPTELAKLRVLVVPEIDRYEKLGVMIPLVKNFAEQGGHLVLCAPPPELLTALVGQVGILEVPTALRRNGQTAQETELGKFLKGAPTQLTFNNGSAFQVYQVPRNARGYYPVKQSAAPNSQVLGHSMFQAYVGKGLITVIGTDYYGIAPNINLPDHSWENLLAHVVSLSPPQR